MVHAITTCVGFVVFFTGSSLAYTDTSFGSGTGVPCNDAVCAEHASCSQENKCVCSDPVHNVGNGYFKCVSPVNIAAYLITDPVLMTYEGEHANLDLPCRFDFTEALTHFIDNSGSTVGSCYVHVRGFNMKNRGKFFVHGVDVAFRMTFHNQTVFEMSVRKYGVAHNGIYDYTINATDGTSSVDGPFLDDDIAFYDVVTARNIVECTIDKDDNLAIIKVPQCGIFTYFRPYDTGLMLNQPQSPGIAVVLELAHGPSLTDHTLPLALIPTGTSNAPVLMANLTLEGASNSDKILYRAISNQIPQNNPSPNSWCTNATLATNAVVGLPGKVFAYERCTWMLRSPRFIRCYDTTDTGEGIMELFTLCIQMQTAETTCPQVQALITASGCQDRDPDNAFLNSFMLTPTC